MSHQGETFEEFTQRIERQAAEFTPRYQAQQHYGLWGVYDLKKPGAMWPCANEEEAKRYADERNSREKGEAT
jgi:hypothetical protein